MIKKLSAAMLLASLLIIGNSHRALSATQATLMLYVAPHGSDSSSGSAEAPFATIQRALTVAVPNTTINITAGQYTGPISLPAIDDLSLVGQGRVLISGSHGIMTQTGPMKGLTLSGLTFLKNKDVYQGGAAVSLEQNASRGLNVQNCAFLDNGWAGLTIGYWNDVKIKKFIGSGNGENALSVYRVQNLVETEVTLTGNNVVGYAHGYIGDDANGEKLLRIHGGTLSNVTATDNLTGGVWFDTDNENITVRHLVSERNLTNGFFCEATQGPITLTNSVIAYNGYSGIVTGNCQSLTVTNTVIYGNVKAQIQPASSGPRTFNNYVTGAPVSVFNKNWTLTNDQIGTQAKYPGGYLWGNAMADRDWPAFLLSLTSNSNDWYSPNNPYPFALPTNTTHFAGWQRYTRQDRASSGREFPAPAAQTSAKAAPVDGAIPRSLRDAALWSH
ncbi:MAG: right-handed parallel beta-helix repeat-containing protein [Candidatus Binataceae bacterium]